MNRRATLAAAALTAMLSGCGDGGGGANPVVIATPTPSPAPSPTPSPTPTAAASVEREINPAVAGAGIVSNFSPNFAINPDPAVTARNKLFVMLPGTGGVPRNYRLIVRTGAQRGYHALGLTYPNDNTVGDLCAGSATADCNGLVRREILTGEDTTPLVTVNAANSIAGRLTSLLGYLSATYPGEGWGQYLIAGKPDWSKITMAGHSQGSGHAAYAAKLQSVDRAVMFSGPGDTSGNAIAVWFDQPAATPASRLYGFTHVSDELVPFALVTAIWSRLGLGASGNLVSVDGAAAPFSNSHQLSTAAAPSGLGQAGSSAHNSTVVDVAVPLDGQGQPLFRPVWIYLAFP